MLPDATEEEEENSSNDGEGEEDDEGNEVQSDPSQENSSEESDYEVRRCSSRHAWLGMLYGETVDIMSTENAIQLHASCLVCEDGMKQCHAVECILCKHRFQ